MKKKFEQEIVSRSLNIKYRQKTNNFETKHEFELKANILRKLSIQSKPKANKF